MMMMMMMLLLFLALAAGSTGSTISAVSDEQQRQESHEKWVQAVEGILANLALGPLKAEFTPAFLAQRTRDSIIGAQRNYFRAYVARILMQSMAPEGLVYIEPPPEIAPEVVQAQVQELKDHSFSVRWVAAGVGNGFVVNVPRTPEK